MKYLIVGSGSIGKRHIRNLISMGVDKDNISAIDARDDRRKEVVELGVSSIFSTLEDALNEGKYDAAIVCSPTHVHIKQAIILANNGIHILMEKPLDKNLDGIEELNASVKKNNIIVNMAYIFRFSPLTKKVKEILDENTIGKVLSVRGEFSEYLPDWHPWEDYRTFYMAEKSQGGGSILDQSHIMDLVHYLFGGFKSVYAINSKISSLEINADDFAEMLINMKSGIVASVHTDIFGRDHRKQLEIKGEKGNILWDFYASEISVYDPESKVKSIYKKFSTDFNLCYIEEVEHFIACCNGKEKPIAPLQDGIETMQLIAASERSQETKKLEEI